MPLSATMNTPSPAHGSHQQMYACKPPPFDPFLCEQFFPKTTVETEESSFTQVSNGHFNSLQSGFTQIRFEPKLD